LETTLDRFLTAQEETYPCALQEIKDGQKRSHWMWYIFPQILGLGRSSIAQYYAIADRSEAEAYLHHPVLGPRLEEITTALLMQPCRDPQKIFGYTDSLKLRSSMTLFETVSHNFLFRKVLDQFFQGQPDPLTLDILKTEEQ